MKRTAFISHSSKDKTTAEAICNFLESKGISCWIAPRDVRPGKNYGVAIVDAIDECDVFVLILSAESNKSGQVVREVERAASANAVIIPVRVEPVQPSRDLEFYVSSSHWLDATQKPLEKHLGTLVDAIRDCQNKGQPRENVGAPAASDSPAPEHRSNLPLIVGGAAAAVAIVGFAIVLANRHQIAPSAPTPAAAASPGAQSSPPRMGSGRRRGGRDQGSSETGMPNTPAPITDPGSTPTDESSLWVGPAIAEVTASSQEHVEGQIHTPQMAFDGRPGTTWLPQTDGVGQWIMVRFKSSATINSISIINGNGFNQMRYESANHVRTMRVTFSDGTSKVITFEEKLTPQRFELGHPVVTEWAKFEILSVFPGTKFPHTPVGEIQFNRPE